MGEVKLDLQRFSRIAVLRFSFLYALGAPLEAESVDIVPQSLPCDTTVTFDRVWSIETPEDLVPFAAQPVGGGEWLLLISSSPGFVAGVYPQEMRSRILFASSTIQPVGARWSEGLEREGHLELVSRDGRVMRIVSAAAATTPRAEPVTAYALPIKPSRAIWAYGAWFVAAVDSITGEARVYRVRETDGMIETDTLLRLSPSIQNRRGSWHTNDPLAFSASQDGILVTERDSPYRVYRLSADTKDIAEIAGPAENESVREQLEARGSGGWIGMNTVQLWGRWHLQTFSDTRSDRRVVALHRDQNTVRVRELDAPMSFVAVLDSNDRVAIAVTNFAKFALAGYRWRPVCPDHPGDHVSSSPKGAFR